MAPNVHAAQVPGRPGGAGQHSGQRPRVLRGPVYQLQDGVRARPAAPGRSLSRGRGRRRRRRDVRGDGVRALTGLARGGDGMTTQEAGVDGEFRQQVVEAMTTVLARLLDRSEPVTESMRLMEELGLSSTLGLELMLELEDQLEILIDVELMDA